MGLTKCFDASTQIPQVAPKGYEAVLGYIGLDPFATHTWTTGEWQRFRHLHQFPAFVPELSDKPGHQAELAVAAAVALGWHEGRIIVLDLEAWLEPVFYKGFAAEVEALKFRHCWYGSGDNAAAYADLTEYRWLADPGYPARDGIPDGFAACQDAWGVAVPGGVIDSSLVSPPLLAHAGVGARKG